MQESKNLKRSPKSVSIQALINWKILVECKEHSIQYCTIKRDSKSLVVCKTRIEKHVSTFAEKNPEYMESIINEGVLVNAMMDKIKDSPQKCSKCGEE